jgi:hypothetical protein
MHAERDHLNRVVFPELRKRCHDRGVEFVGVDLRWGLTPQGTGLTGSGALDLCLDEIERCRPFFVCFLGDRYGWIPPSEEIPGDVFTRFIDDPNVPGAIKRSNPVLSSR